MLLLTEIFASNADQLISKYLNMPYCSSLVYNNSLMIKLEQVGIYHTFNGVITYSVYLEFLNLMEQDFVTMTHIKLEVCYSVVPLC